MSNQLILSKEEGLKLLNELLEELVDSDTKKKEIEESLLTAYKERKEVIAKYALHEISQNGAEPNDNQREKIRLISYNFV